MSKMNIRGSEYPIKKIFSDDFVFTIPLYQRAYAWTAEQSEELLQDLLRAMDAYKDSIEDLSPYFLGSIVLIKEDDNSMAEVIDGQQRLTTLTMLLSALRGLIKNEYAEGLTSFLCEKGNIITGTPSRYRLRLRERDAQFFQKYIQDEGGIAENFDFEEKKQKYFSTNGGISPFVLTTQVLRYREWTPAIIEQRQSQLIETLKQLWRL
jgi:uncharacterized protein with ParB-like and HNH nuclease domain